MVVQHALFAMRTDEAEQPSQDRGQSPLWPAACVVLYALLLGYNRGELGFLLVLLMPFFAFALFAISGLSLFRAFKIPDRRRECYVAAAIIFTAPLLTYLTVQVRDPVRFMVWAPFHLDVIQQNPGRDGVLAWWNTWGGLGWFNAAYLARDRSDGLSSLEQAKVWKERQAFPCEIVGTQRVWQHLYVVTTSQCEL
jgi:hypothetical protein